MSRQFRLPDGNYTPSATRYANEWNELTKAVEDKLDVRVYAFDPDLAVCMKDGRGSATLPLWLAKKIIAGVPGIEQIPEGWKPMPPEATEEMLTAAAHASMQHLIDCINDPSLAGKVGSEEMAHLTYASRYREMFAVAPTLPDRCDKASTFPERDTSRPAEEQGLFRKFDVRRVDGSSAPGGKHHGCEYFVLDTDHDPHAPAALMSYAKACAESHPQLSADLTRRYSSATVPAEVAVLEETYEVRRIAYLAGEVWLTAHGLEVPQELEAGDMVRLVRVEKAKGGE